MNNRTATLSPAAAAATPSPGGGVTAGRPYLDLCKRDFTWPLLFCLCLTLTGLRFPLGYIGVFIILLNRFRADRHEFLIMLTLAIGGYGLADMNSSWGPRLSFAVVPAGLLFMSIIRKPLIIKKTIAAYLVFAASMFVFAFLSEEKMSIQLRVLMNYLVFAYFVIPLAVFSGREFDLELFSRKLVPYILIISAFYILDACVFCGMFLLPTAFSGTHEATSFFWDLYWRPFSFNIVRKWPIGMLLVSLIIYPSLKFYRLRWWMWALIAVALGFTRTFTVVAGLLIGYFLFQGNRKQIVRGMLILAALFPLLYFVDGLIPARQTRDMVAPQSALRVKSSVDQIFALSTAADEDDLAEFASGRIGQVIPRFELMYEKDRELIGLGFLDPGRTTNPKFIIYDEFLDNKYDRWRVATRIEISPLQVMITVGYLGFIILTGFYALTCWFIRKLEYRNYYYSVMFLYGWYGLSDFGSYIHADCLMAISLIFSVVILANRHRIKGFARYRAKTT
ncbi:MAG: hypothetical protein K2K36_09245 [Muribaculaceae bacterium]|nr:hypothetical protein [Muribaculaceae bacterium]